MADKFAGGRGGGFEGKLIAAGAVAALEQGDGAEFAETGDIGVEAGGEQGAAGEQRAGKGGGQEGVTEGGVDFFAEGGGIDGFAEEDFGAEFAVARGFVGRERAGADDDGQAGEKTAELGEGGEGAVVGHIVVEDGEVERVETQGLEGLVAVADADHIVAGVLEKDHEDSAAGEGVTGDKNARSGRSGVGHGGGSGVWGSLLQRQIGGGNGKMSIFRKLRAQTVYDLMRWMRAVNSVA